MASIVEQAQTALEYEKQSRLINLAKAWLKAKVSREAAVAAAESNLKRIDAGEEVPAPFTSSVTYTLGSSNISSLSEGGI